MKLRWGSLEVIDDFSLDTGRGARVAALGARMQIPAVDLRLDASEMYCEYQLLTMLVFAYTVFTLRCTP